MADKKTYTIEFQGVKEAINNIQTLGDTLDKINTSVKATKESNSQLSNSNSELAKTVEKLKSFDAEYQKQLALAKSELTENTKAIKQAIQAEQDQAIITANVTDSYKDKQTLLSALGRTIKSYVANTEEEKAELSGLKERYAEVNQSLKDFDSDLGNFQRNVGNYTSALNNVDFNGITITINGQEQQFDSLKQAIRACQTELQNMAMNGQQNTTQYQALTQQVASMKDAMDETTASINNLVAGTSQMKGMIEVATSATAAFGLVQSSMAALGIENENYQETIVKLQAALTALTSLEKIQEQLNNSQTFTAKAYNAILETLGLRHKENAAAITAETTAQTAANVATTAGIAPTSMLATALNALPFIAIISAIGILITNFDSIVNWFKKTVSESETLTSAMNWLGDTVDSVTDFFSGLYNVIKNTVITGFKTLFAEVSLVGNVLKDIFTLNWDEIGDDIKNGMDNIKSQVVNGADAISKAYDSGVLSSQQARITKQEKAEAEARAKDIEKQQEYNDAKYGSDYKYTQEGIALQRELFEKKKKMYDEDSDEYYQVTLDEMRFERELTEHIEKQNEQRNTSYKKASEERIKIIEETLKKIKELEEGTLDIAKENNEKELEYEYDKWNTLEAKTKEALDYQLSMMQEVFTERENLYIQDKDKAISAAEEEYNAIIAQAEESGLVDKVSELEEDKQKRIAELQEQYNKEYRDRMDGFNNDIQSVQENYYNRQIEKNSVYFNNLKKDTERGIEQLKQSWRKLDDIELNSITDELVSSLSTLTEQYADYFDNLKELYGEDSEEYKEAIAENSDNIKQTLREIGNEWNDLFFTLDEIYDNDADSYISATDAKTESLKKLKELMGETDDVNSVSNITDIIPDTESVEEKIADFVSNMENITQEVQKFMDNIGNLTMETIDMMLEASIESIEERIEELDEELEEIQDARDDIEDAMEESEEAITDLNNKIQSSTGATTARYKADLADQQKILAQQVAQEQKLADEEAAVEEQKQALEDEAQAKEEERVKLSMAKELIESTVEMPKAVMKTYSAYAYPVNVVFSAIVSALYAAQLASMASQISKYATGGIIGEDGVSRSHSQGGHKIEDTNIEVEGGEWVINKKSSAKYNYLLNAINNDDEGTVLRAIKAENQFKTKFATGGILNYENTSRVASSINTNKDVVSAIKNMNFNPVVSVVDFEKVQNRLVKVRDYSGKS